MPKRKKPSVHPPPPLYYTIPEVCTLLGLGRTKVYDLIKRERLPICHFGRATRVPVAQFHRWIERRAPQIA